MDIQPQNQQPISDDQELAKVLAGVSQQADEPEVPVAPLPEPPVPVDPPVMSLPDPIDADEPEVPTAPLTTGLASESLDSIKQDALTELRPLIDKLDVSPEEKFDTYLLLLRSTDDKALIGPAHEAARLITDEARRAQALLDIIKEIDFLSGATQPAA